MYFEIISIIMLTQLLLHIEPVIIITKGVFILHTMNNLHWK